jgi:hypothetical protein
MVIIISGFYLDYFYCLLIVEGKEQDCVFIESSLCKEVLAAVNIEFNVRFYLFFVFHIT